MSDPHYHINVFWSEEDGLWLADVPDLRYCTTHGETPAAAVENVREAIQGWLETAQECGIPIPEPRYKPAKREDREAA